MEYGCAVWSSRSQLKSWWCTPSTSEQQDWRRLWPLLIRWPPYQPWTDRSVLLLEGETKLLSHSSHYYFWKIYNQTYILICGIYKVILRINQIYLDPCKRMSLVERIDINVRNSNDFKSFWSVHLFTRLPQCRKRHPIIALLSKGRGYFNIL